MEKRNANKIKTIKWITNKANQREKKEQRKGQKKCESKEKKFFAHLSFS